MGTVSRPPERAVESFPRSDSMSTIFPVIFTETADKETPVLAYIPDLDGMTEGKAIADAIAMAKDYICNALFDKANPETPNTRIDEIDLKESPFFDSGKSFVSLVDVDLDAFRRREKSKSGRQQLAISCSMAQKNAIQAAAKEVGLTTAQYVLKMCGVDMLSLSPS